MDEQLPKFSCAILGFWFRVPVIFASRFSILLIQYSSYDSLIFYTASIQLVPYVNYLILLDPRVYDKVVGLTKTTSTVLNVHARLVTLVS